MPREIPKDLTSIGGKSTALGRENFLQRAAEIRAETLAKRPNYRDITEELITSDFRGTLSKTAAGYAAKNRRGKRMPKQITKLNNVSTIAGKRGRKAEFNPADWGFEIGLDNALDVTEEMLSGIEKYQADNECEFDADDLFTTENTDANKYRNNRFGAFKRVAIAANGEDTKYTLNHGENEDGEKVWILVRTA